MKEGDYQAVSLPSKPYTAVGLGAPAKCGVPRINTPSSLGAAPCPHGPRCWQPQGPEGEPHACDPAELGVAGTDTGTFSLHVGPDLGFSDACVCAHLKAC